MRLKIKGGLRVYFFTLSKRMSWIRFVGQIILSHSIFLSITTHVHIRHRRDYDKQKAVVVV